jgi:hypothetical protein
LRGAVDGIFMICSYFRRLADAPLRLGRRRLSAGWEGFAG